MPDDEPKWRRRKDARPSEIVDAALEVFAEKGFAAAKLDDIARRAGVSKATLYLYFDTKKEIFRAVARAAVASLLEALQSQARRPTRRSPSLRPGSWHARPR
jgi:AcrR family transcriptional regulator